MILLKSALICRFVAVKNVAWIHFIQGVSVATDHWNFQVKFRHS